MWFDKVKAYVGWDLVDRARIAKLRRFMDADYTEMVESLGKQLTQCKDTQPLMANARFAQRLHAVIEEWLMGLLDGTFDEAHIKARWDLGRKLAEIDLSFEDIFLLEHLARRLLCELAQEQLNERPQVLWATMYTLDKALCLDLALTHNGYLQVRESEMEQAMLNRFFAITGFSRTLYENLAEAREWSEVNLEQTRLR